MLFDGQKEEISAFDDNAVHVCSNSHVVNPYPLWELKQNKNFCDICGEPAITECENCHALIKAQKYGMTNSNIIIPRYCSTCGASYEWAKVRLEAARDLADDLETINSEEQELLKQSINDLVRDTPRTAVATNRFKRLVAKAGPGVGDAFKDILVGCNLATSVPVFFC